MVYIIYFCFLHNIPEFLVSLCISLNFNLQISIIHIHTTVQSYYLYGHTWSSIIFFLFFYFFLWYMLVNVTRNELPYNFLIYFWSQCSSILRKSSVSSPKAQTCSSHGRPSSSSSRRMRGLITLRSWASCSFIGRRVWCGQSNDIST